MTMKKQNLNNLNRLGIKTSGYFVEITPIQTFIALGVYIVTCCVYKSLRNKIKR